MVFPMKFTIAIIAAAVATILLTSEAKAITCYALTDNNHLLAFDSSTPGTATNTAITGVAGYSLVGIDFRTTTQTTGAANPGVGSLWAIGTDGTNFRLFVINPSTAVASAIGGNLAGVTDGGAGNEGWGFGFDPSKDQIRFIGFHRNYSINPNTLIAQADPGPIVDGNIDHNLNGAAYTTASFGGTSQFYAVDDNDHELLTSANLSASGVLTPVGLLGFANTTPNGLDIYEGFTLWAGQPGGTSSLFNVNRSTGAATKIGDFTGNPLIRGLAILPASFPPQLTVTAKIKGPKKVTTDKTSLLIKGTASSQAGITLVQYKIGKGKFKKAKGTTNWKFTAKLKPGVNKIQVQAIGGNSISSSIAKITVTRSK